MLVTVVEELYRPEISETLYLDFEGIDALRMYPADVRHLKNISLVGQVFVCAYLVFLICTVIVEHTDLHRDYRTVCFVLTDHIYVFVSVCTHNIPIRILPPDSIIEHLFDIIKSKYVYSYHLSVK